MALMFHFVAALVLGSLASAQEERPRPVPLVVHDPFFSLWSTPGRPTDGTPSHASGRSVPMCVLARIDGDKVVRLLGTEPPEVPAPDQSVTIVDFTTTRFVSLAAGVELELAFVTPALPDDLDVLARPVTYVQLRAWSRDGNEHSIDLYLDVAALAAVEGPSERVQGRLVEIEGLETACVEALDPPWRAPESGRERLERGTLLASARKGPGVRANFGPAEELRRAFVERRGASVPPSFLEPRPAADGVASVRLEGRGGAGFVTAKAGDAPVTARAMLAYDEPWSVRYFEQRLRPYWRGAGIDAAKLLQVADAAGEQVVARCGEFDRELSLDLATAGDSQWIRECQRAYRSVLGASKLCADAHGRPLLFVRGAAGTHGLSQTMDVAASAPQHLLLSSDLAKASLLPLLDRATWSAWTAPFAPCELGTYPHATGTAQESVATSATAVADSSDLILLVAAICQREGRVELAARYWKQLSSWSRFLIEQASAPQDSALAADSRAKSIVALGAFARLARQMGSAQRAEELELLARTEAADWERSARTQDEDSVEPSVALAWDKALQLRLFGTDWKPRKLEPVFLTVLAGEPLWNKWFARGAKGPLTWAPARLSIGERLVPDARGGESRWSWTTSEPAASWTTLEFDVGSWSTGSGAFGAPLARPSLIRTRWTATALWLRRTFELASIPSAEVRLAVELVGDAEVWLNGALAARLSSGTPGYFVEALPEEARAALRVGANVLAIRCTGQTEAACVDAGLVTVPRATNR